MRVTQKMMSRNGLNGMQDNLRRLSEIQRQAVTGRRGNRPSDDPFAVEQSLGFRSKIAASENARKNIDMSKDWLLATDKTLSDAAGLLLRSKNLNLQGANEALGPEEREAVAIEVNQILEEMVDVSNTRHGDDHLFSGFQINSPAFIETRNANGLITSVTANGDISGQIVREVEPGIDIVVNVPGDTVFDAGPPNIFESLINLRDYLNPGPTDPPYDWNNVSSVLGELDTHMDSVLDVQAAVGTKIRRLTSSADRMGVSELGMKELRSKAEDADMAEVVTELNQQQFIYETALAVNGKVLRTSLLDFIQ